MSPLGLGLSALFAPPYGDIMEAEGGDFPGTESVNESSEMLAAGTDTSASAGQQSRPLTLQPTEGDAPYISFPLPRGNAIEIRLRSKVSPEDFQRIKKLVELPELSLVDAGAGDIPD